jgi:hypothetical protein
VPVQACCSINKRYSPYVADPKARVPDEELATRLICPVVAVSRHCAPGAAPRPGDKPSASRVHADWRAALQTTLALALRSLGPAAPTLAQYASAHPEQLAPDTWAQFARVCARAARLPEQPAAGGHSTKDVLLATSAARCVLLLLLLAEQPATQPGGAGAGEFTHSRQVVHQLPTGPELFESVSAAMRQHCAAVKAARGAPGRTAEPTYPVDAAAESEGAQATAKPLGHLLRAACVTLQPCNGASGAACAQWIDSILANQDFLPCATLVRTAFGDRLPQTLLLLLHGVQDRAASLPPARALQALCALIALLAGPAHRVQLPNGQSLPVLRRSPHLADPVARSAYLACSCVVLGSVAARPAALRGDAGALARAAADAWPLVQSAHLLDLMAGQRDAAAAGAADCDDGFDAVVATYALWLQVRLAAGPALRRSLSLLADVVYRRLSTWGETSWHKSRRCSAVVWN